MQSRKSREIGATRPARRASEANLVFNSAASARSLFLMGVINCSVSPVGLDGHKVKTSSLQSLQGLRETDHVSNLCGEGEMVL